MDREHEEQAAIFHDSWRRLWWVEQQVEEVRKLAQPLFDWAQNAPLRVTIDETLTRQGHIEFVVDDSPTPPTADEINFRIGNIVTDARSCLDMAIDSIWNDYALDRARVHVQFPLEDDFGRKRNEDRRLGTFLERLDERFVEVIELAQPDYAGGIVDIPSNLSAILISKLSNANKHRNITPIALHSFLSGSGTDARSLKLTAVDADERRGVPPLRFALEYDALHHSDQSLREDIAAIEARRMRRVRVSIKRLVVVDRQEIILVPPRFDGRKLNWRADLDALLEKVPGYVRLVLRNLNRAHAFIQGGDTDDFYLLDQDAGF